jgi:hypothetical protein
VALGLLLLYLGYSIGVRHGCSLGKTERETLRDGLDAALRQVAEIPPFEGPYIIGPPTYTASHVYQYRRPMGPPRRIG